MRPEPTLLPRTRLVLVLSSLLVSGLAQAATFNVSTNGDTPDTDTGDNVCTASGGGCTLRAAIQQANATAGTDTISFSSITGGSPHVITAGSALPDITGPVILDGATAPEFLGGTPVIVLNGASAGAGVNGLRFVAGSSGSTLRALVVQGFAGNGVVVNSDGNTLVRNLIGTNAIGTAAVANGGVGISIVGNSNTIGGADYNERDTVSGNGGVGVSIAGNSNSIRFSFVGTTFAGAGAIPNASHGVVVSSGTGTTMVQNVISGNSGDGVRLTGGSGAVIDTNNLIGLNQLGNAALANTGNGVSIVSSNSNTIGPGNVISGNALAGVAISGTAAGNVVKSNFIGVRLGGTAAIGNGGDGVTLTSVNSNTIGGPSNAGNAICGNAGNGVTVTGGSGNSVLANDIGLLPNAGVAGNGGHGVAADSSVNLTIGLTAEGASNYIVASGGDGVHVTGAATTGLLVAGNNVGGVFTANSNYGNTGYGIYLSQVSGASIGGDGVGQDNLVGYNHLDGISINGGSGTLLKTNEVGVESTGFNPIGNLGSGIVLTNHTGATLTFNLVGYNTGDGLRFVGGGGHLLHGMQVGLKIDGMSAAPNGGNGLTIDGSANNVVGEPVASQGNSFSGNLGHGVVIRQAGSTGNTLRNNLIGANLAGTGPVANSGWGILVDGAGNNTIGGNAAVDGNLVAYNGTGGIAVLSGTGNAIRVNRLRSNGGIGIDLDADGALPADGPTANDNLDADTGGNRRQNYPVLTSSTAAAFSGVLKSTPNTTYTLDGYSSASADPSGFGEGEVWIGATTVTTDAAGNGPFIFAFATQPAGSFFTATVTAPTGDTSELSKALILGGTAPSDEIFSNGFETGNTGLWSSHNP